MENSNNLCKVCQYKPATVLYFGIGVCSGCRAFFLRSMKADKSYDCFNNRLCGKSGVVTSNRRACKKCRLERCLAAGMLEAKNQLKDHLENLKTAREQMSSDNLIITKLATASSSDPESQNVLELFNRLRQQLNHERQQFYGPFEDKEFIHIANERDTSRVLYEMYINVVTQLNKIGSTLFGGIETNDFNTLVVCDFPTYLAAAEIMVLTIRNYGHKTQRIYRLDNSYIIVGGRERLYFRWQYIRPYINDLENNEHKIFNLLLENGLKMQQVFNRLSHLLGAAKLDDYELSALLLLLMSREACTQIVKQKETCEFLRNLRKKTLKQLAQHIQSTGQNNVIERMGQIVMLMAEFQEISRQIRKYIKLVMITTNHQAWPNCKTDLYSTLLKFDSEYIVP